MSPTHFGHTHFEQVWNRDEIPNKRSHEVERDLMEWEGLVAERQKLCMLIEAVDVG